MSTTNFKPGDHIFYRSDDAGHWPCVVQASSMLGRKRGRCVKVMLPCGKLGWVSVNNCQLQEEWRKENEQ